MYPRIAGVARGCWSKTIRDAVRLVLVMPLQAAQYGGRNRLAHEMIAYRRLNNLHIVAHISNASL